MLWKLLSAGIERVEGIGAVGSVFEKVFFGLGLLLHRLVLAEAVALKLMDNHPMEVLVVHGIVRAKGCGIIVVDDRLVWVWSVIGAEVGDERRDFQFRYAPVTVGSGCQVCDSPKIRANEFKQHALLYGRYYPARLLILAKKQPKYLEITKFQSIFAKE